nr:predicted GPI-anchored protein 58 [Aegilops tauschii subsp. strangulata]
MAPAAARREATNGSPPNHRQEARSQPAPAAKSTHRESHPAPLAAVQGPEQGSPDWRSASTHHQHARPTTALHAAAEAPAPPARHRASPAPAGPPDLAEPRPGRHRNHEHEPPRAAHRAATKPSLPRRKGPPPRLHAPHQREAPSSSAAAPRQQPPSGMKMSPAATGADFITLQNYNPPPPPRSTAAAPSRRHLPSPRALSSPQRRPPAAPPFSHRRTASPQSRRTASPQSRRHLPHAIAAMSCNASTYSNHLINVHARVPVVLDASNSTYFT